MTHANRLCSIVTASLLLAATAASAESAPSRGTLAGEDMTLDEFQSTGPAIILDLVLVRPLGLVATVIGGTFFILGAPFEAATHDFSMAGHYLVEEPARYTFKRPLGELTVKTYADE
jgi:hypothetical protein